MTTETPAGPEAPVGADPAPAPRPSRRRTAVRWAVVVVLAALLAVSLRLFVVQTFSIPSTSMVPTLQVGDYVMVDKLAVRFGTINRGDIVVFARPADEHCGGTPVPDLVKRVIGLPGDRISSRGNTVYIDGKPLAEPWLPPHTPLGPAIPPTTVPKGEYYMLGDNRALSCDSRYWGPIPRSLMVGKVVVTYWPLGRLHWF